MYPRELATLPTSVLSVEIEALAADVRAFAEASRSKSTRDAYSRDFERFRSWCESVGATALPADPMAVAAYFAACAKAGSKPASLKRYAASINEVHRAGGHSTPVTDQVGIVLKGIRQTLGTKQRQARPILPEDLRAMVEHVGDGPHGTRDRAMLLLGFAMAARRSELVALDVGDVRIVREGLEVTVRRSKTDQEARGSNGPDVLWR